MADTKISSATALTGANLATTDKFPVADASDTAPKYMTAAELSQGLMLQAATKAVLARLEQNSRDMFGGQVNCFTRTMPLGNPGGGTASRYTSTSWVHRWRYHHRAFVDCGDLRWVFANVFVQPHTGSAQGIWGVGNDIWVTALAYLAAGSRYVAPLFNGVRTVKLKDWNDNGTPMNHHIAISDYIPMGVDQDALMYGLYAVKVGTIGDYIPVGLRTASSTLTEGISSGDISGTATSGGGAAGFHPVAILGTPVKGTIFSYAVVCDSIGQGYGASDSGGIQYYGWLKQAFANVPHMPVMAAASRLQIFDTSYLSSLLWVPSLIGTHKATVFTQGVNDLNASVSLANLKAWLKEGITQACRNGAKNIVLCTLTPYTDTKVNWTTYDGQVPGAGGSPVSLGAAAVANGTPAEVTKAAHGLSDGQLIYLSNCGNIAPGFYYVKPSTSSDPTNTFLLYTDSGLTTGATASGTYSSTHAQYASPTAAANEVTRRDFNTWIRDGTAASEIASEINALIPVHVWDLALAVETDPNGNYTENGGYWKASNTADGLHPNDTGHAAMAAVAAAGHAALEAGAY